MWFSKKIIPLALISTMFALSGAAIVHSKESTVAILNMGEVFTQTKAVLDIERQITAIQKKYRADITVEEKKLRDENTLLLQQRTLLSEEQYLEKRKKFKVKATAFRKKYEKKALMLRKAKRAALDKVRSAITPIVTNIANERVINVILANNEVLFSIEEIDITKEVMSRLDKKLKTVKIDVKSAP